MLSRKVAEIIRRRVSDRAVEDGCAAKTADIPPPTPLAGTTAIFGGVVRIRGSEVEPRQDNPGGCAGPTAVLNLLRLFADSCE